MTVEIDPAYSDEVSRQEKARTDSPSAEAPAGETLADQMHELSQRHPQEIDFAPEGFLLTQLTRKKLEIDRVQSEKEETLGRVDQGTIILEKPIQEMNEEDHRKLVEQMKKRRETATASLLKLGAELKMTEERYAQAKDALNRETDRLAYLELLYQSAERQ